MLLLLLAFAAGTPLRAQQKIERRWAATPNIAVRISGAFGVLKVTGWSRDSLVILGSLPKGARFDGGAGVPTSEPSRGAKFYVEQLNTNAAPSGTLELFVPSGATVWAKSGSATIEVTGVTGGLDLNVVGGGISVEGNPRELNIESMDGSVAVNGSPGWMRVKTATGNIRIQGSSPDAGFMTVGGSLEVREGIFERVRVESVTGDVTFAGLLARAGSLTVDSHSGTVDLQVSPKASLELDATTIAGNIVNNVSARRPTPGKEGRGEELKLTIGAGSARVTIRTFKGGIRVR